MLPMEPKAHFAVQSRPLCNLRRCRQTDLRLRNLVVSNHLSGRWSCPTAEALDVHGARMYQVT